VNISNPTSNLNRMHFRNNPTPNKFWEIGAATKATDALSGWTVSYDDGGGNYNYHLAVYGDGKVALGDSINDFNSSIFDVFGSTTLHDTLSIKTDHGPGYSFPVSDGTPSYVMQTDGVGNVAWVDPSTLGSSLWTDAGTETYLTDLTDNVGIGTVNPLGKFHTQSLNGNNFIVAEAISNSASDDNGSLQLLRARGTTEAAKANLIAGDRIGSVSFNGYGGGDYREAGQIIMEAEEAFTGTDAGSKMIFSTTPFGTTSTTEAMVITADQNVGIGANAPITDVQIGSIFHMDVITPGAWDINFISNNLYFDGGASPRRTIAGPGQVVTMGDNAYDISMWNTGAAGTLTGAATDAQFKITPDGAELLTRNTNSFGLDITSEGDRTLILSRTILGNAPRLILSDGSTGEVGIKAPLGVTSNYDLTLPIPQGPHHYFPRFPLLFLKVPNTSQKVRFASFISGGFITAIVVNLTEKKLAKITSVHYSLRSPKNQFHK
jgi:hypothetical protein